MTSIVAEDAATATADGQDSHDIYYDQHDVVYRPRMLPKNSIDDIDLRHVCRLASSFP